MVNAHANHLQLRLAAWCQTDSHEAAHLSQVISVFTRPSASWVLSTDPKDLAQAMHVVAWAAGPSSCQVTYRQLDQRLPGNLSFISFLVFLVLLSTMVGSSAGILALPVWSLCYKVYYLR